MASSDAAMHTDTSTALCGETANNRTAACAAITMSSSLNKLHASQHTDMIHNKQHARTLYLPWHYVRIAPWNETEEAEQQQRSWQR